MRRISRIIWNHTAFRVSPERRCRLWGTSHSCSWDAPYIGCRRSTARKWGRSRRRRETTWNPFPKGRSERDRSQCSSSRSEHGASDGSCQRGTPRDRGTHTEDDASSSEPLNEKDISYVEVLTDHIVLSRSGGVFKSWLIRDSWALERARLHALTTGCAHN